MLVEVQDEQIAEAIAREQRRLRSFIRRYVPNPTDVEDVLQDVFHELVIAYRLMKPIERVGAWLFRVAQSRITDRFRKKKPEPFAEGFEDWLPSLEPGPDAAYARTMLLDALERAVADLSEDQRRVFLAHEVEGISFEEMSRSTGVNVNTLISRKHAAVTRLRKQLRQVYREYQENL
jgi:RNA polymerase sigma factor (sigma-70 family)